MDDEIDWNEIPDVTDTKPVAFCFGFKRYELFSEKVRPRSDLPEGLVPSQYSNRVFFFNNEGNEIIDLDWAKTDLPDSLKSTVSLDKELAQKLIKEMDACLDEYLSIASNHNPSFERSKCWTTEIALGMAAVAANRNVCNTNVLLKPEDDLNPALDFVSKIVESVSEAILRLTSNDSSKIVETLGMSKNS